MKNIKKVISILVVVLLIGSTFSINVKAAEAAKWIPLGNGRHQLEGTEVILELTPGVVHITGSGTIPDYGYWDLKKRPWATSECVSLVVDDTITSIGAYAFYELPKLKYISISSKTYIKDATSFGKNAQNPVFRIAGSEVMTEMFGNVPYTSMDSIKAFAQSGGGGSYVFDDGVQAKAFQESTNPTIPHVFVASDASAPWNDLNLNGNGNKYTPICKFAPGTIGLNASVTGMRRYQGRACYQVFGTMIEDYTFAGTFDIVVEMNDAKKTRVTNTTETYRYVLNIPQEFQKEGRTFRLLSIGKEQLYTYEDLDAVVDTVTFETNFSTAVYALVYKDR